MTRETKEDLAQRIAELEAENHALKSNADRAASSGSLEVGIKTQRPHRRSWAVLATVLIIIGAILAPLALVASWAKIELTDTDRFVATYAPLAKIPAVQDYITDETVDVIDQNIDVKELTSNVIDGITSLGTGPVATKALDSMKGPAAAGIHGLIQNTVSKLVSSDQFAAIWRDTLRVSHSQLVAAMQNNPNAAIKISGDGSIGIQLAPVITAVKKALIDNGIGFARHIPKIDKTIVIAQSDAVPTIQVAYRLAIAAGSWLPWASLTLLIMGVLMALHKARALIWAAIALALSMALTLSALTLGKALFTMSVSPSILPSDVAGIVYSTVVATMQTIGTAILVLAVAAAAVGWFAGPFVTPRRLRRFYGSGVTWVRDAAERQGISTGRTGEWFYRQRVLLRWVVTVIASVLIIFIRPLTASLIVWTLAIAVLVVAILEFIQRPTIEVAAPDDDSGQEAGRQPKQKHPTPVA